MMYSGPPHQYPSSSRPPQPEWRLPSAQSQGPVHAPPTSSSPHPATAVPSYSAASYGLISGSQGPTVGVDTSTWGVKYNQQHQFQPPPPLPPRPSSSTELSYGHIPSSSYHQTPVAYSETQWPPTGHQQWPADAPGSIQQSPPPRPPPLPSYESQMAQQSSPTWHQHAHPSQYASPQVGSNHPASDQYDADWQPLVQSIPPSYTIGRAEFQNTSLQSNYQSPPQSVEQYMGTPPAIPGSAPPLPPKTTDMTWTGASALGTGSPSDWEHFQPPGHTNDVDGFKPRTESPTQPTSTAFVESPAQYSATLISPAADRVSAFTPPLNPSPTNVLNNGSLEAEQRKYASPTSSNTSHWMQEPLQALRTETTDSGTDSLSINGRSDTIDGVIEAWKDPISPGVGTPTVPHQQGSESNRVSPIQHKSPIEAGSPASPKQDLHAQTPRANRGPGELDAKMETMTTRPTTVDPYEDLDPWFKSSLDRYVSMLRKEAVADSDHERFKLFTTFVAKETKLREILYSIEDIAKREDGFNQQSGRASGSAPEEHAGTAPFLESGLIPATSETSPPSSADEAGEFDDVRYSPGGRPILPNLHTANTAALQRSASHHAGRLQTSKSPTSARSVTGTQTQSSRPTSVPPSMSVATSKQSVEPLKTNTSKPIYTPFRYTEGPQRGSDDLTLDRPAYQAYSALRQAGAQSGRVMSNAPSQMLKPESQNMAPTPLVQNEHDETFVGLIREKSDAYRERPQRAGSPPPLPAVLKMGKSNHPIDSLRTMVSTPLTKQSESSWHVTTRKNMEQYGDDFGYVKECFNQWERNTLERRQNLDTKRMARQQESESHIDALFNEREIGYADINTLEEEFRQREARVQLDEERKELDDFISNVSDSVHHRLQKEINALQTQYDSALGQLDHENIKSTESTTEQYNVGHTMKAVNQLYRKLELRYQKRLEIALDRERRRKKAERRPLVFTGDSPALRQLDGQFDRLERETVLEAARGRDARANRLMDTFDDAILHGLGENQNLLDDISAQVRKIEPATIQTSGVPESEIEQMLKSVFTLVDSLRRDSEAILHHFGIADSALNNADYGVSVAEARCSHADVDVFRRLDAEKRKEDAKIKSDLESKLNSVRNSPAGIITRIDELLGALGKDSITKHSVAPGVTHQSTQSDNATPSKPRPLANLPARAVGEDPEHQERLQRALEDAKKRNAARHNPSSQTS